MTLDQLKENVLSNVEDLFSSLKYVQDNFPKQEWPARFKQVGEDKGFPCSEILEVLS